MIVTYGPESTFSTSVRLPIGAIRMLLAFSVIVHRFGYRNAMPSVPLPKPVYATGNSKVASGVGVGVSVFSGATVGATAKSNERIKGSAILFVYCVDSSGGVC